MNFNFELILFYAVVVSGVIALFDILFLEKKRKSDTKLPILIDYARSFFPVLLLVFLLRSFFFEPYRIPSGSLLPTLNIGDFILVNKYHYGVRLPVIHTKIIPIDEPKRGDIIVFRWPPNPRVDFIKRVIGTPGDKISYVDKILYVNGIKMPQIGLNTVPDDNTHVEKEEDLSGVKHLIYENSARMGEDFHDIIVPMGMYFVMGDNRDDSADSRYWGFVPDKDIIGKAKYIWMSWDSDNTTVRWKRIGNVIH